MSQSRASSCGRRAVSRHERSELLPQAVVMGLVRAPYVQMLSGKDNQSERDREVQMDDDVYYTY